MDGRFLLISLIGLSFIIIYQLRYTKHLWDDGRALWNTFYNLSKKTGMKLQENTFSGYRLPDLLGKMKNRLMLVHPSGKYTMMVIQADLNLNIDGEINIRKKGKSFYNISVLNKEKVHIWDSSIDDEFDILTDDKELASKAPSLINELKTLFDSIKDLELSSEGELILIKINESELTVSWKGWLKDSSKIEHLSEIINDTAEKLEDHQGRKPTNKKPDMIEKALNPTSSFNSFETILFYITAFLGLAVYGGSVNEWVTHGNIKIAMITSIIGSFILLLAVPRIYIKKKMVPSYINQKKKKSHFNYFYILSAFYLYSLFGFTLLLLTQDYIENPYISSVAAVIIGTVLLARSPSTTKKLSTAVTKKYNSVINRLFFAFGLLSILLGWVGILELLYVSSNISYINYITFTSLQFIGLLFLAIGIRWKKVIPKDDHIVLIGGMGNLVKEKEKIPYDHIKGITKKHRLPFLKVYGILIYPPREKSGILNTRYTERIWKNSISDEKKFLDNIEDDKWISWERFMELQGKSIDKNDIVER